MKQYIKIRLNEILNERKEVGPLYYFAKYSRAINIIKSGFKLTSTIQPFVSFTRNKNLTSDTIPSEVRFTIDGGALSNKYKIIPYADVKAGYGRNMGNDEAEERISLSKYPNGVFFGNVLMNIEIKSPIDVSGAFGDEESHEPAKLSEFVELTRILKQNNIKYNLVKKFS